MIRPIKKDGSAIPKIANTSELLSNHEFFLIAAHIPSKIPKNAPNVIAEKASTTVAGMVS
jgi:hypothetical protein